MTANASTGFLNALFNGSSFKEIFDYGSIEIRSGVQPANADAAVTGTLLARITKDGGLWTAGVNTNGLKFQVIQRYVVADPAQAWRTKGIAAGTAGWFRLRANAYDDGLISLTAPRIDGTIRLVGEAGDTQMYMHDVNVTEDTDSPFVGWTFTIPPL